ncbi:cytochrome f-like [Rutidosis leptorrhynchoides]|uniref:cytochrome f-like n=1 Tax=Rutidosis leptorrhynchoides TaxID=125765 RepID=UPI003A98D1B0
MGISLRRSPNNYFTPLNAHRSFDYGSTKFRFFEITYKPRLSIKFSIKIQILELRFLKTSSFQSYRPNQKNILVIGPVPGQKYSEITFPILSPDPATKKDIHFLKYPIYVGGNRGRGQIYPDRSKSNNTVYNATASGIVSKILRKEKGGYEITIAEDGRQVVDIIPPGPELLVSEGESIKLDQPLTSNPNVSGFGQGDAEIVLQDPLRVQGLLFFFASVILAQVFLVLKKKDSGSNIHGFAVCLLASYNSENTSFLEASCSNLSSKGAGFRALVGLRDPFDDLCCVEGISI